MKKTTKLLAPLVLIPALALSSCADEAQEQMNESDSGDNTLTVYTSEPQEKIDEIIDAFAEVNPDAEIDVFRAGTGELKTRVASEKETGEIQADVILAADVPTFEDYAAEGDLAELNLENTDSLDDSYVDEDNYWVGTRLIPTIIAVNTDVISEEDEPSLWQDLTNSDYEGQIAMPNPDVSGAAAFNTAVWRSSDELGDQWLEDLVANDPTILESNGPVGQAVGEGTTGLGIVVDYVIRDLADQGSQVKVVYPEDGAPYVSQPAGVFADSDNQELANQFVDFLISEDGQQMAAEQSYLPVRDDVGVPEGAPELADLNLMDPDLEEIAAEQDEAVSYFNGLLK
ncbi:ABC transporter substrate-binding protein [Auritidibacter ignavus]|uniref:ABC transporter substrate-binding protein n=1 Tax=Auritidibacter ignavus TaxID=678932 RepID=UPI00244BAC69|nr:ABC transporter substrate-binding protein [Auritidibacter ignavus]WGH84842.1 ABC transporter substrate-binding protein [Auritidibacter ignavus]WGH87219.1 ABC transporter substrate-binding protein [Auritidibacter ignavus]WGH89505.1 ABC transporter substrate-binding protein [Auritidibacter ignavus]WHS34415.1 ABC transporter substrate-binding protein [Auritidibacter ignavus]